MAVSEDSRVRLLPFRAFGGALPAGLWLGQGFVVGDASGGLANLNIQVNLLSEPFSALIMTLEQVTFQPSLTTTHTYLLEARGFTTRGVASRLPHIGFAAIAGTAGPAALFADEMLAKPFYLGQIDRMAGLDTELHWQTNNADGETFIVNNLGYYWTPEAMNAPGGPQRPQNGLFGA